VKGYGYSTTDEQRDGFAELGEPARAFYEGLLSDNPSSRVRAAVEEVIRDAARRHRTKTGGA
jgi:hypothetical protein